MIDCSQDILAYHDQEVTLAQHQRTAMRNRRNANRERLVSRLKASDKPTPEKFIKQGSYATLTMVQDPNNDYDIDDGIYYYQDALKDKNGNPLPPKDVRQVICDVLKDDRFNKQPRVLKNCVRVFYEEGYHVDMPIYRIRDYDEQYELSAGDQWVLSRAADVEEWFAKTNQAKSPDETNGRQFRRIVRLLKKFARSRESWKDQIANGFTVTKLVEECYVPNRECEDVALRETMKRLYFRLLVSLEVRHPVTPGSMLTKGPSDEYTNFLKVQLSDALEALTVLDDSECSRKQALAAWDKVFNTTFFSKINDEELNKSSLNADIFGNIFSSKSNPRVVDKQGGGTFA